MDTRIKASINQITKDVHFLTAPLRLIFHALLMTLFLLSFPLVCALVSLHYVIGNISLVWAYCHFMSTHQIPDILYPFVLLGAFAMIPVEAVVLAVQAVAEVFDGVWRGLPLFGITLLALVNSFWMLIVRAVYAHIDDERLPVPHTFWFAFFGFAVSLLGQFYVLPYRETAPPAARNSERDIDAHYHWHGRFSREKHCQRINASAKQQSHYHQHDLQRTFSPHGAPPANKLKYTCIRFSGKPIPREC